MNWNLLLIYILSVSGWFMCIYQSIMHHKEISDLTSTATIQHKEWAELCYKQNKDWALHCSAMVCAAKNNKED